MNQTYKNLREILQKHKENMPIKVTAELLAVLDEVKASESVAVFDWLREQCKDRSESCYKSYLKLESDEDYGCSFAYAHAVDLINEAEAKWEAECCIWKPYGKAEFIENPHTRRMFSNEPSMKNVCCNTCGKPIKIAEVE